jgi:hypothetical protein
MSIGYWETLASISGDGTALTAAARASLLQGSAKSGLYTLPANKLRIGDVLHLRASGRISCVVTTPGSITFDLSAGVGGTAFFSSGVIPLNIVAKTNVPWILDVEMIVRAVGNAANLFGMGFWLSEAALNVAVPSTGPGPGGNTLPYNTAPAVGSNVDFSIANIIDFNFTQTVATGSVTLHNYALSLKTSTGF